MTVCTKNNKPFFVFCGDLFIETLDITMLHRNNWGQTEALFVFRRLPRYVQYSVHHNYCAQLYDVSPFTFFLSLALLCER